MENVPSNSEKEAKERKKREYLALAKELSERQEGFPFPGIRPEVRSKIKAEEGVYPGYGTPIDELVARFEAEGMKIVLGEHPESGNVFILPLGSNDIEQDNLFPRQLMIADDMEPELKKLIEMNSQR